MDFFEKRNQNSDFKMGLNPLRCPEQKRKLGIQRADHTKTYIYKLKRYQY